jgi:dihydrofolate reductase
VVSLLVAHARNRTIGRDGGLPWHLPADMRRFRELTTGHTVVMGRKTFQSLPEAYRPLPNRRNLVLSRDLRYEAPGAEVFSDLQSAFDAWRESALDACAEECFVIGGGDTYREALPLAGRVHATEIEEEVEGDTFFPALAEDEWRCLEESERMLENGHAFTFRTYERMTEPSLQPRR